MATVWVTGASSGLGLHTAQAFVERGWQVVGGARSFKEAQEPGLLRLPLDVVEDDAVAAFVKTACERHGAPDALVNAAGILVLGACEDYTDAEWQGVLDTNFLGMARLVRHTLPLMRAQGRGRIVNFSSVNGVLSTPFQGAYAASKHAVEGFSEALRMETAPHHIQVMVVRPGDHRGGSQAYRRHSQAQSEAYRGAFEAVTKTIAHDELTGADPARLGRRVASALERRRLPAVLHVVKAPERAALWLHDILPPGLFSRALSLYYGAGRGARKAL